MGKKSWLNFKLSILYLGICVSLCFLISQPSFASPAEVILIRHGEKPAQGAHLNERGRQRAKALVSFFTTRSEVLRFGTPVAIYAMNPGVDSDDSDRPIETVQPLAEALGLPVLHPLTRMEIEPLVQEIKSNPSYNGKMVLICWEHKMIPAIANLFGADDAPHKWHGGTFDRAWVIDLDPQGQEVRFQDFPEQLLAGDSEF